MEGQQGRHKEALGPDRRDRRRVWSAYMITGAALAILRVAFLLWLDHEMHHGRTAISDYLMWMLYPEGLLVMHTPLGLLHFPLYSWGYLLFWGSIVVLVSFVLAMPILLVGWLTRRRR